VATGQISAPTQTERDIMSRSKVLPFRAADKQAAQVKAAVEVFNRIDPQVRECAGDIAHGFDRMIPLLHELEPILSRKGKNRIPGLAGLPMWQPYLKELGEQLGIGIRQVQRLLKEYRGKVTASSLSVPVAKPAARWTLRQQRQAAKALDVARKAFEAIKTGKAVKPYLNEWNIVAYTPVEPLDVDPVSAFIDLVLTPYAVRIIRYLRALEDVAYYHVPAIREDREHRLWEYKRAFYDNAPQELREVFYKARKIINAAKPTGSSDGTPVGGRVQVPEPAPTFDEVLV
jgi:hypothetical protein